MSDAMTPWQEHTARMREIRHSPMVEAWISAFQTDKYNTHADCLRCGYPHSPYVLCGMGAAFGRLQLGKYWYAIESSNVVFFHDLMLKLGEGWGFHWRNETFFKRADDGTVEVRYFECFNNSPQEKIWRIPPNEWASIVASVSATGETSESYNDALKFHAGAPHYSPAQRSPMKKGE